MSPLPDPPAQQLDLFADGREQMLRNDLATAVMAGQVPAARAVLAALREEDPGSPVLEAGSRLLDGLEAGEATSFVDVEQVLQARAELSGPVHAAAQAVLGPLAADWLRPRWAQLARRAACLAFQAGHEHAHAASLWCLAEEWAAMAQAVEGIESWRRQPAPLAWMALARARAAGTDAAWPLLCELAWMAPRRVEPLVRAVPDHALHRLWRRFETSSDDAAHPDGACWWPAWALVEQPLLVSTMDGAQPAADSPPEVAWLTLRSLLRLERQGRRAEVLTQRLKLRNMHQGLFDAYMRQR